MLIAQGGSKKFEAPRTNRVSGCVGTIHSIPKALEGLDMEIAALISFAAIVIAWIVAPDGRSTQSQSELAPARMPVASPA